MYSQVCNRHLWFCLPSTLLSSGYSKQLLVETSSSPPCQSCSFTNPASLAQLDWPQNEQQTQSGPWGCGAVYARWWKLWIHRLWSCWHGEEGCLRRLVSVTPELQLFLRFPWWTFQLCSVLHSFYWPTIIQVGFMSHKTNSPESFRSGTRNSWKWSSLNAKKWWNAIGGEAIRNTPSRVEKFPIAATR